MDRSPLRGGAVECAQLGFQQIGAAQQQARAAHAQEGVFLHGQAQVRHLLVAADVQRPDDQRSAGKRVQHASIGVELFVLAGRVVALEEQEFGAHQAHAFGALFERGRDLFGADDVAPMATVWPSRVLAGS